MKTIGLQLFIADWFGKAGEKETLYEAQRKLFVQATEDDLKELASSTAFQTGMTAEDALEKVRQIQTTALNKEAWDERVQLSV